jgi:hypothetical protein
MDTVTIPKVEYEELKKKAALDEDLLTTLVRGLEDGPVAKRTSQRSDENSEKHPIFQSFYRRETTLFSTVNI